MGLGLEESDWVKKRRRVIFLLLRANGHIGRAAAFASFASLLLPLLADSEL